MADQIVSPTATQSHQIFEGSYCESISYDIRVKTDEVKLHEFREAIKWDRDAGFSHCAPKFPGTDYHLHVSWRVQRDSFRIGIEFVKGRLEPTKDEEEPFAENFIEWMEKFFIQKKSRIRLDADFEYPSDSRETNFPLPSESPIGPHRSAAVIDGISFELPDRPAGISKVWVTRRPSNLYVHVFSQREIEIASIDPRGDVNVLSTVMDAMLQPKRRSDKPSESKEQPQ